MDERPVIRPPRSKFDHLLDIFSFCGALTAAGIVIFEWPTLPARIPSHFDTTGAVDAWGGRWTLVLLAVVATVLYVGMSVIERYPHRYNYPIEITSKNAGRQYALARRLVSALKLWAVWLILSLILSMIAVARGELGSLPWWGLASTAVVPIIALIAYFVSIHRETEDDYPTIRQIARRELDDE